MEKDKLVERIESVVRRKRVAKRKQSSAFFSLRQEEKELKKKLKELECKLSVESNT